MKLLPVISAFGACILLSSCDKSNLLTYSPQLALDSGYAAGKPGSVTLLWTAGADTSSRDRNPFGQITDVNVDGAGDIYVLDGLLHEVRVFSADGVLLRRFGRAGDGPGEFRNARGLTVGTDTVFVLDNKLKMFTTRGSVLPAVASRYNFMTATSITHTNAGIFVLQRFPGAPGSNSISTDVLRLMIFDPKGPDTVHTLLESKLQSFRVQAGLYAPYPRGQQFHFSVDSKGRTYIPAADSLAIRIYSPDGRLSGTIARHIKRVGYSDKDDNDYKTSLHIISGVSDRALRGLSHRLPAPEFRPVLGDILVTDSLMLMQRLDLSPNPYAFTDAGASMNWVLSDKTGNPRCHFQLPARFKLFALHSDRLIGARKLADDSQVLVAYGVPQTACN